jgi:uncharacterized protein
VDAISSLIVVVIAALLLSAWAHLAENRPNLARTLYVLLVFSSLLFIGLGLGILLFGDALDDSAANGQISRTAGWLLAGLGIAIGLPQLRPVRQIVSRFTSIDPDSIPDMVGLISILSVSVFMAWTLTQEFEAGTISESLLIAQGVTFLLVAYFAVGGAITRDLRSVRQRLGLEMPAARQVAIAFLLVIPIFAISITAALLTQQFQPEFFEEVQERTDPITQDLAHVRGALVLGISAGVGEEALFRGAMQPRFGILLTSIVFSLIHIQYGFSFMLAGVFLTSIVLGFQRKLMNTTACIITHAFYNFCVVMIAALPAPP